MGEKREKGGRRTGGTRGGGVRASVGGLDKGDKIGSEMRDTTEAHRLATQQGGGESEGEVVSNSRRGGKGSETSSGSSFRASARAHEDGVYFKPAALTQRARARGGG
jgi:hypothetical protein